MHSRGTPRGRTLSFALGTSLVLGACADAPTVASGAAITPGAPSRAISPFPGQAEHTITAGGWYSLAVKPDGTVAVWGRKRRPLPGEEPQPSGSDVPDGLSGIVALSAFGMHALALRADGTVAAWGGNQYGQASPPPLSGVVAIGTGDYHSLAVRNDGTVAAWGDNRYGQTNVPAGLSDAIAVTGGIAHSVALRADGTVVCWGDNQSRQSTAPAWLGGVIAIAAGQYHSVALRRNGTVVAWGLFDDTRVPEGLSDVVDIAASGRYTLALKRDGTVVVWGNSWITRMLQVPAGLSDVVAIDAGYHHAVALRRDGTVAAWGFDELGETLVPLGLIARVPNFAPQAGEIVAPARMVSGHRYTFAVAANDRNGDLLTYAWDMDSDGTPEQTSNVAGIYYAYPTGGTHTVRVTITDAKGVGIQRSAAVTVEQNVAPVAAITPIPTANEWALVYPRAVVTDANSASDPTGLQYAKYAWDFGDGTTSTDATPSKRYTDNGTYRVQLTVTDRGGASTTTETQVQIANVAPRATFMVPAGTSMPVLSAFVLFARNVTDSSPYDRTSLEISFDCGYGYYGWTRDPNAVVQCVVHPGATRHSIGMRVRDKDGAVTEYRRNYTLYTMQ